MGLGIADNLHFNTAGKHLVIRMVGFISVRALEEN